MTGVFFRSIAFRAAAFTILTVIVILLVFQFGMYVGFKRADFSHRWGENYYRNFAPERRDEPRMMMTPGFGREFQNAHGVLGEVVSVEADRGLIKGNDGTERIILFSEKTIINKMRDIIKFDELKIGDYVVIIGRPNSEGQLEAQIIRVMPKPPAPFGRNK